MSEPVRVLLAGGTVALLEAVAGGLALAAYGPIRFTLFLFSCAMATALVGGLVWVLVSRPPDHGDEGPRGPARPPGDPSSPDGPDPDWWPRFERDFRAQAEDRELTNV